MEQADRVEQIELAGAGGLRLVADVAGPSEGPQVVLLHGGGQTRHAWRGSLLALAARGWRAYSVDLRGHGDSDWAPDGDYTIDAFANDVTAVARALRRPALVGASLGGISALMTAGEHDPPPASALVLVDVAPKLERAGTDRVGGFMRAHAESGFASLDEVADAIAAYNPHRPRPTDLSGLRKNVRQRADGRWVWHWDPEFLNGRLGSIDESRTSTMRSSRLEAAARGLTVPTLLVRGRMSDILSEEGVRQMLELAPHTRFVDVAGAGHMVVGDRNDVFNDVVFSFLEDVRGGAAG